MHLINEHHKHHHDQCNCSVCAAHRTALSNVVCVRLSVPYPQIKNGALCGCSYYETPTVEPTEIVETSGGRWFHHRGDTLFETVHLVQWHNK